MPQATTTLATIRGRCQNRVGDTSTNIWTSTADGGGWSNAINDSLIEIYNDIISEHALVLCDILHDSVPIILVNNQENYNYINAIEVLHTKSYSHFVKAMWGNYPVKVFPFYRYHEITNGTIIPTVYQSIMFFWGINSFKLRPIPSNNEWTFTFYFLEPLTPLDDDDSTPELDERIIPLLEPKVAGKYWRRRQRYELSQMEDNNYERDKRKIIYPYRKYPATSDITMSANG